MAAVRVLHLVAGIQVDDVGLDAVGLGYLVGKVQRGARMIAADVEDLVARARHQRRAGDHRGNVIDVGEGPRLKTVSEDRHGLSAQDLIHENPHDVSVLVGDVLVLPVDVVRPEDDERQVEHLLRDFQIELDRVLGDAVGVLGSGHEALGHRKLVLPVDRDGRCEHETADVGAKRPVDQGHRACDVVRVVEAADEMRKAFRGISGEVIDEVEALALREIADQEVIVDAALDEANPLRHVRAISAGQVVQPDDLHPEVLTGSCDMAPHEARRTGDQDLLPRSVRAHLSSFSLAQRVAPSYSE